jgi:hypothetical protein
LANGDILLQVFEPLLAHVHQVLHFVDIHSACRDHRLHLEVHLAERLKAQDLLEQPLVHGLGVLEYLKHYSEERQTFWDFEQRIRSLTNEVYDGYVEVHKAHTKKLTDFPKNISPCIFRLHAHYLEHLKPEGESVRLKDAIELINNMSLLDQRRLMTPPRAAAPVEGVA